MTLGKKIASLRNAKKMSQSDLAEKLDVSRQSVSKWETGASVPELDKLITMSDIFNISIDELVKSDSLAEEIKDETKEIKSSYILQKNPRSAKQITGFILLGCGIIGGILGFIFSAELLFAALCLVIFGIICLATKKYTGLLCGWFALLLAAVPIYIVGYRLLYTSFLSCLYFACVAAMIIISIVVIKKKRR
ncbi:MAG: helix-turn-helix domain-containing protein [Acutalibacteraceae bacterium]